MFQFHETEVLEETAEFWWAGKNLARGKLVSDFVGKNNKTKIIGRLQKAGGGPTVREAPIDQETQQKMMA